MTENLGWSASAGRWMGVPVRVHMTLFLFVALIFGVQSIYPNSGAGTAFVTTLCLLVGILLHEFAHIFALSNFGGHVNSIVLTPWGGNSDFSLPDSAKGRAIVFFAGPFFSGCLFALGATLLLQDPQLSLEQLVNPFRPSHFDAAKWELTLLKISTWVNFQLMIVNLIPCFPFDGAGLLRSLINGLTHDIPVVRRESTIMVIGYAVGLTLIGLAWFASGLVQSPIRPVWLFFVLAGITLIFSAKVSYWKQVSEMDDPWDELDDLDYESVYSDSSLFDFSEDENSSYSQWLMEKHEERDRHEREQEDREKDMADEILKKLHRDGIESLDEDEKAILHRVSARIRRRRQSEV